MGRWQTPECTHEQPGPCRASSCRYHEPACTDACALSHVRAHGPRTQVQVAALLGVTPAAVWAAETRAIRKLDRTLGPAVRDELEAGLRAAELRPTEPREPLNMADIAEVSMTLQKRAIGSKGRGFLDEPRRRRKG